jgi:hypothetical protein
VQCLDLAAPSDCRGMFEHIDIDTELVVPLPRLLRKGCAEAQPALRSGDIDARDVKAQEAAEGCAEYERPQEYRQYR